MRCRICKKSIPIISKIISCCKDCLIKKPQKAQSFVLKAHQRARIPFGFPYLPPKEKRGVKCASCLNQCQLKEGQLSFCGMRKNEIGILFASAFLAVIPLLKLLML